MMIMKKQLLLFFLMMLPLLTNADAVEIDGIYYNLISEGNTAEVTRNPSSYTGNITIPEQVAYNDVDYSVTSIGEYAFQDCHSLSSVTIGNNVISIGRSAFDSCYGLTDFTIPNSVTAIGDYAFIYCTGLTSVTIGNGVTSIGYNAFHHCTNLASIIIPNSVTIIGDGAFWYCSGMTSVTIGNSVTSIGEYAFNRCSGLTSVTIPNSVTTIGDNAFDGVDFSFVVSLIENPFMISGKIQVKRIFSQNTFDNATLYVPVGATEKYQTTDGWKDFAHMEEGVPSGIKVVEKTPSNNATVYDLNGVRQSEMKRGINIISGKKVVVK